MVRDFSESAKQKLLDYVKDVTETTVWGRLGDIIGDIGLQVQHWFGALDISKYINNLDEYHKKVIDKNDTTTQRIEEIFTNVKNIDIRYQNGLNQELSYSKSITDMIKVLSDTIDPNGGNMNMQKMNEALAASLEKIRENQLSKNKVIEESMLGTDPDAVEMSTDPVNLSTGNFVYDHQDLIIGGEIPLAFHRYYNSKDTRVGTLGKCFLHNYEVLVEDSNDGIIGIRQVDGQVIRYEKDSDGNYHSNTATLEILKKTETGYVLDNIGKERKLFKLDGKLIRQENWNGRGISFTYNKKNQLVKAKTDNESCFEYFYDESTGYLTKVQDHTGRSVDLTYKNGMLEKVALPLDVVYTYVYGNNGRIVEVVNAREVSAVKNEYDNKYRVTKQFFADGGMMSFVYDDERHCVVLTERNGVKTAYFHDENYRNTETVFEDGTSEKFLYNEKNQCISKTNRLGCTQRMAYDNRGNLTQIVDSLKRRFNFTYDANNNLISVSMNGKGRLKNHYDAKGKLIATENCMKEGLWITYDENQHPVELTLVDGSKTRLSYDERGNVSSIRESNGNVVYYTYDALNRVIESKDVNNYSTKYQYDLRDKIIKVTNPLGNTREYIYDKAGRVTGIKDFDGFWTLSTYNAIGKIETITDKEAYVMTYGYDKMWNITSQTMPDGTMRVFEYDEDNRLSVVEYPNGGINTYTYDAVGNKTSVTDAEGNITTFVYDAASQLIEVIEPDGAKTKNTYDREGNLVAVTNAMGHVISYTYDDLGRCISRTNAEGATTSLLYNNMGQVERVCYPNGTQTIYAYDLGGRVKSVKNPDGSGEIYEYDLKGNLISRANGIGDKISFKYDALDRLVEIVNQVEGVRKFTYDTVGNLTSIIDEKGNKTTYDYSPNGNIIKVADALGNETFYEYDEMNRLIKTICTGINGEEIQSIDYVWDVMGQIKSVTDPLGHVESYEYDKNGNMTSKTDRDGYTTNFTYGSHGKIEEIAYADGKTVEMSYDALRRLNEVEDWNGITKIVLDTLGRAVSVTEPNGDTVGYEWGMMGERKAIIYPDGKRAEYKYNNVLQLIELYTGKETVKYKYDEIGRLTEKQLPSGITTSYHYNKMGRIDEIFHIGNEFEESYQYSFDIYGNKIGAVKQRYGIGEDSGRFDYVYDELNRLTEVHQNDTLLRQYSYDAYGNRTSKSDYTNGTQFVTSYIYNANNQLLSETNVISEKGYTYDNRGNLLKVVTGADLLREFVFDAANQMTESVCFVEGEKKKATYNYNGLGHRIGQEVFGIVSEKPDKKIRYTIDVTRQYYNLLQKYEEGIETHSRQNYYWDGNVVAMELDEADNFYLQDDLGSPMHLIGINGTVQESFAFDEFGESIVNNNTEKLASLKQVFGFTGYQENEVDKLYFAQSRHYDSYTGRFINEDKMRGNIITPISLNHYTYCWNDPENMIDKDGNVPMPITVGVDVIKDNFSSPLYYAQTSADGAYAAIEVAVSHTTQMPEFRTYLNSNGTKMVAISNSSNYIKGSGGIRSISEAKLLNPDVTATNYASYEKLGQAYKWNKGLKAANKALIGIGGVIAFCNEYQASEGLETEDRIINGVTEAAWSIGSAVAIGALVGSVVPGAGTAVGAAIGFVVGAAVSIAADVLVHAKFFDNYTKSLMDYVKQGLNCAWDTGKSTVKDLCTTGMEFLEGIGREQEQAYCISVG